MIIFNLTHMNLLGRPQKSINNIGRFFSYDNCAGGICTDMPDKFLSQMLSLQGIMHPCAKGRQQNRWKAQGNVESKEHQQQS